MGSHSSTVGYQDASESLVQFLLEVSIDRAIEDAIASNADSPIEALFKLRIADPACGNGRFLVAAAHRLANGIARVGSESGLRMDLGAILGRVIQDCIYGVDVDSQAVEQCRTNLALSLPENVISSNCLTAHICCGNALIGTTPELMKAGIPDSAWDPLPGDERRTALSLKRRNKYRMLAEVPWAKLGRERLVLAADSWCAAFFWPKLAGALAEAAPINEHWQRLLDPSHDPDTLNTKATVSALAAHYDFFHWHVAFPEIFAQNGFDVLLGNPPWAAGQDPAEDPLRAHRDAEARSHFLKSSRRYPLTEKSGRIPAHFVELARTLIKPTGRATFLLPAGVATGSPFRLLFTTLVENEELGSLLIFGNHERLFPEIEPRFELALLQITGTGKSPVSRLGSARDLESLKKSATIYCLRKEDFAALNPNTRSAPSFQSSRDAELNLAIHRRVGILWRDGAEQNNPWGLRLASLFHLTSDSRLFRTSQELESAGWKRVGDRHFLGERKEYPVFEARTLHHFDFENSIGAARSFAPRFWVAATEVEARLDNLWGHDWLLCWRSICSRTDRRTLIANILPIGATPNTLPLLLPAVSPASVACLLANLNSFVADYLVRQKLTGIHLRFSDLKQLPLLSPQVYDQEAAWNPALCLREWILRRTIELAFTTPELEPFARDCGYFGPVPQWDSERRSALRAELDAAFFHLYRLELADIDFLLDSFTILRSQEEKIFGNFRTRERLIAAYEALASAIRQGRPYQSPLLSDVE